MKNKTLKLIMILVLAMFFTSCGAKDSPEEPEASPEEPEASVEVTVSEEDTATSVVYKKVYKSVKEKEPLSITWDYQDEISPVSLDIDEFNKFDGMVTMTFDIDVADEAEFFGMDLSLASDGSEIFDEYSVDLSDYIGEHTEISKTFFKRDLEKLTVSGRLYLVGDGFVVNSITFSGYKNEDYVDPYEGLEPYEIVLDYPGGMDIASYDYSLTVNVDLFDQFTGEVSMIFDTDVLEEAEWYSIDFMTVWETSGFGDDLGQYAIDLYSYRGKHANLKETFTEEDIERFKKNGILTVCGCGYKLNTITLKGYKNTDYKAPVAPDDSPVAVHGQLSIKDGGFVDKNGESYRLLGAAVGWDTLCPQLVNVDTYSYLRDEWGMNTIRVGMEAHSDNGKNGFMDPEVNWDYWLYYIDHKIDTIIAAGLYAVIDYHNYQNPLDSIEGAERLFTHIAEKYAGCPNIIYEIGNEPNFGEWKHTKQYADKLIPLIRSYSPDAVIICPSDGWAQKVIDAYKNPLDYENVIYTFHLYCNPFMQDNYNDVKKVLEAGFPVFLTEYNICGDAGDPTDSVSIKKWEDLISKHEVSYLYHNILINYEDYGNPDILGLQPEVSELSGWTEGDMGISMKYFYHLIRRDAGLE